MKFRSREHLAMHVSRVSIFWNVLLSSFKFFAGLFSHSGAMISDAVHSASDVFSTLVVMIGVKAGGKAADQEHPYGHERMECVAALLLSVVLFATGLGIGISGLFKIISPSGHLDVPGFLALAAAAISIAVKETMYWYTRGAARKIQSGALMADAWHHRSDALSSVGSFAGILGARLGFPILDPIASVAICLFIVKAAVSIFLDSVNKMVDRSCTEDAVQIISDTALEQRHVLGIDEIHTRLFGDRVYVDLEIRVDGSLPLRDAHAAAEAVHNAVENRYPQVKHCMVHVNPGEPED